MYRGYQFGCHTISVFGRHLGLAGWRKQPRFHVVVLLRMLSRKRLQALALESPAIFVRLIYNNAATPTEKGRLHVPNNS